jgi:hypothetical protein
MIHQSEQACFAVFPTGPKGRPHYLHQSEFGIFNDSPIRNNLAVFPNWTNRQATLSPPIRIGYFSKSPIRNNPVLLCFQLDQQAVHIISTNQN